ncbi:hypothetical protein NC652_041625 [Populus alba x Populus x berolinensis]|nr:hypothetical protein NC652_041625 [Populus alba x Populus x berolinensis]
MDHAANIPTHTMNLKVNVGRRIFCSHRAGRP